MLKKHYRQIYSIFSICAMVFQSVAPTAFLVAPAYAATHAEQVTVESVTLSFSKQSNEFSLAGVASANTQYLLTYNDSDDATPEQAALGSLELTDGTFATTIYAGTCSNAECIAHEVVSGSLQFTNSDYVAHFTIEDGELWLKSGSKASIATVELGVTYVAPQNSDVRVTFTQLPENPGSLVIEEVYLSDEQVAMLGAVSNVAYDITSSMPNNTFQYELALPKPNGTDGSLQVVYAESVADLSNAQTIHEDSIIIDETVTARGLDHFTVFVVVDQAVGTGVFEPTFLENGVFTVDNGTDGYTETVGTWQNVTDGCQVHAVNGAAREINRDTASRVVWKFTVPEDGTYKILAHWVRRENNTNEAKYEFSNSLHQIIFSEEVNQKDGSNCTSRWETLGEETVLSAGTEYTVTLRNLKTNGNSSNFKLFADAIRVELVGEPQQTEDEDEEVIDLIAPNVPTGLRFYDPSTSTELSCGVVTTAKTVWPRWDANTEADFSHYEYTSFDATLSPPGWQIGLDEVPFVITEFQHGWVPPMDGVYGFAVRAVDTTGNKSDWAIGGAKTLEDSCQYTVDNTAPSMPVITFPSAEQYFKTTPILNQWTAATDAGSGVAKYQIAYLYDDLHTFGGSTCPGEQIGGQTLSGCRDVSSLSRDHVPALFEQGGVTIWVRAIDTVGNVGNWSEPVHYYYDATVPTTTLTSPTAGSFSNSGFAIVGSSVDENGVDFVSLYYQLDGESSWILIDTVDNALNDAPFAFAYDWTPPSGGVYNIKASGTDVAGNVEASAYVYGLTYDVAQPALVILAPSADSAFNGQFTVHGTTSDALSGIDKVRVRFRNESDNALVATYWATYNSSDNTWSIDINDGTNTVPDGYYLIRVASFDKSGNTRSRVVQRIHVDRINPSSVITTFNTSASGEEVETNSFDGLIEGTATDDNSGVAEVELEIQYTPFGDSNSVYWNGSSWQSGLVSVLASGKESWSYQIPAEFLDDGMYEVTSHAKDRAGNVESTYTIKIVYDKTIPTVSLFIDPASPDGKNGWYRFTKPTIVLTASDNYEVDRIEYRWNSADWSTYTSTLTPPGEGQNILQYRSIDKVGNPSEVGVKDVKYDKTNPSQPLNVKVENITSNDADGIWQAPVDDSDVFEYVLEWKHQDGTTYGATVGKSTVKHKLTQLKNGLWTFSVKAMDAAGNFTEAKTDFRVGPGSAVGDDEQSSGAVLGVSTDSLDGTGTGGLYTTQNAVREDTNSTNEDLLDEENANANKGVNVEGSVLGESTCSPWLYYLPFLMLLLQTAVIVGFELLRRSPGVIKLLVAGGTTLVVILLFNFLKEMGCYVDGSWLASIAQWFPGISIAFGVITKLIAYGFIEEA